MSTIFAVKTGRTAWEDQQRVESSAGSPLTEQGQREAEHLAAQLADKGIRSIYCSAGASEKESADIIARTIGAKVKTDERLREIDYGLWQGLAFEEIKRRQPKVFRQWSEQPCSVRPPGGETIDDAQGRLRKALKEILRRQKGEPVLLVLRPTMLCLLQSIMLNQPVDGLWGQAQNQAGPLVFETQNKNA
jgi:probable phosphoglycerate mutase